MRGGKKKNKLEVRVYQIRNSAFLFSGLYQNSPTILRYRDER